MTVLDKFTLTVTHEIPDERVRDLLVSALEGGCNYWCHGYKRQFASDVEIVDFKRGGRFFNEEYGPGLERYVIPFVEGCALLMRVLEDEDEGKYAYHRLDRTAMQRGLSLMLQKYPKHASDFLEENDDANTADVWLQLALFGEVIYG